jgi:hypothetical protein
VKPDIISCIFHLSPAMVHAAVAAAMAHTAHSPHAVTTHPAMVHAAMTGRIRLRLSGSRRWSCCLSQGSAERTGDEEDHGGAFDQPVRAKFLIALHRTIPLSTPVERLLATLQQPCCVK